MRFWLAAAAFSPPSGETGETSKTSETPSLFLPTRERESLLRVACLASLTSPVSPFRVRLKAAQSACNMATQMSRWPQDDWKIVRPVHTIGAPARASCLIIVAQLLLARRARPPLSVGGSVSFCPSSFPRSSRGPRSPVSSEGSLLVAWRSPRRRAKRQSWGARAERAQPVRFPVGRLHNSFARAPLRLAGEKKAADQWGWGPIGQESAR